MQGNLLIVRIVEETQFDHIEDRRSDNSRSGRSRVCWHCIYSECLEIFSTARPFYMQIQQNKKKSHTEVNSK